MLFNSLKKIGSKEQFVILIIGSIVILGILSILNSESPDIIPVTIQEDRVFDPLCMIASYDQDSDPYHQGFCRTNGMRSVTEVGLSYYYETKYDYNDLRFFAIKVPIPEIPESSPFVNSEITSAKLQLRTRYDPPKDNLLATERFSIHHGVCDDIRWTEQDTERELTCLSEYKYPISKISTFFGVLDADFIQTIELDVKPHILYALKNNLAEYTETIRFFPLSIRSIDVDGEIRDCLKNIDHVSERRNCVGQYQLKVFSKDYLTRTDFHPNLTIEYNLSPTSITTSLYTVSLVLVPIFATSMLYLREQRVKHDLRMRTACSILKEEINDTKKVLKEHPESGKLIDSFSVRYDTSESPLIIRFKNKFNNELLLYDAYEGVKHSGLLQNFEKERLVEIILFYNQIKNYNENLDRLYETRVKATFTITKQNANELKWGYESELKTVADRLGKARNTILKKIEDKQNGILTILSKEESKFS